MYNIIFHTDHVFVGFVAFQVGRGVSDNGRLCDYRATRHDTLGHRLRVAAVETIAAAATATSVACAATNVQYNKYVYVHAPATETGIFCVLLLFFPTDFLLSFSF